MQSGSLEPPELCDQRSILDLPLLSKSKSGEKTSPSSSYFRSSTWIDSMKLSKLAKFEGGSVGDGILTLLAATIGTGILMIPNSMAASGTIWSVVQMVFCAYLSYFSLMTMVKCADEIHVFSYQELALHTFGHWCLQAVNIASFFANQGSIILYLKLNVELFLVIDVLFGGHIFPSWLTTPDNKMLPVIIATVLVLPLSISKELKALRYFCVLNVLFVLFFCYVVVDQAFDYQPIVDSFKSTSFVLWSGFSTTYPSAVFAYMSHNNILDVFKELKRPSLLKMKKIITWTILFVLIAYSIVGILGYATFAGNLSILSDVKISNGIILIAYGYTLDGVRRAYPYAVIICIITMFLSVVISQPYNIKPSKDSLRSFFKSKAGINPEEKSEESSVKRFLYVLVTLYTAVLVVIFSESAQTIMNVIGSSFFSMVCFIFPSMFYLRIYKEKITMKEKIGHWTMLIFSGVFMVCNTAYNVLGAFGIISS